jgi:TetR/AcrR family transcriptional regulator
MGLKAPTNPREAILEGTLTTIAESKLSGTRMRRIADHAGMSQGNIHYYFPSKRLLIVELLDYMLEFAVDDRADSLRSESLSPTEKLKLFLDQKLVSLRDRQDYMLVFYDLWVEGTKNREIRQKMIEQYNVWRRDIAEVVRQGVQDGVFDPEAARHIPELLVSIMEGGSLQYLIDPENFDVEGHFEAAFQLLEEYLTPQPHGGSDGHGTR